MKDSEQLLHLLMQMYLKHDLPLSFKGLTHLSKWDPIRLNKALKHPWFRAVWGPELRGIGYIPSTAAFRYVTTLFYQETQSPFELDRAGLIESTPSPLQDHLQDIADADYPQLDDLPATTS